MTFTKTIVLTAAVAVALGGCAGGGWSFEDEGAYDPLEGVNRVTFQFNKGVDAVLLQPLARGYTALPQVVQTGVGNFTGNLSEPANGINHLLQGQASPAAMSLGRLMVNTTIGVGGLVDVAGRWGWARQETDFGQTLRAYGLSNTAYLVLPLLGPSTLADATGQVVDSAVDPMSYVSERAVQYGVAGVGAIHQRAEVLEFTDMAEEAALDEYLFIRDAYEEHRQQQVRSD